MRDAGLEAAIIADPTDPGAYAVYADWLQERGDPRGELIAVQLERERAPDDPSLAARERALLAEHEASWIAATPFHPIAVTWRRGFVDTVRIEAPYETTDAATTYAAFAEMPAAIATRAVSLGVMCSYGGRGPDDGSILEALRDHPLPALRELALETEHQISWTHVGALEIAMPALQRLEHLSISAGRLTLGTLDLPCLRSLRIETGGLRAHVLADLAAAHWPSLTSLIVYLGSDNYGGTCTVDDTLPLLAGDPFPALTELGLCNGTFGDELAGACTMAAILPRLRRLDLSKGTMGRAGARTILDHTDRFTHLEHLDLSENYLPPGEAMHLARLCAEVDVSGQRDEDEWGRFVILGE